MLCSELRRVFAGCSSGWTCSLLPRRPIDAPNPLILRPMLVLGNMMEPEREPRLDMLLFRDGVPSAPTTKSTTICTDDLRRSAPLVDAFLPDDMDRMDDLRTLIESVEGRGRQEEVA